MSEKVEPLVVNYCGACTMPLEYCEYSTCKEQCKLWLSQNLPDQVEKLTVADDGDNDKKHQKRGGKGTGQKTKKGTVVASKVTLQIASRNKNKSVTIVKGLGSFGVDLKVASKFFANRFACGSSVSGSDEITIQGECKDDLLDLIPGKWSQVTDDDIDDLGGEGKKR